MFRTKSIYFQGEELIMQQTPQTVQTHHQVVEEILPEQMSDEVTKEVINQFLPQRKRKPRAPKTPSKPPKVIKMEPQASGSENIASVTTVTGNEAGTEMIVEEQEQEQVGEMVEQVTAEEQQAIDQQNTSNVSVKSEGMPKTPKDKSNSKFCLFFLDPVYNKKFHVNFLSRTKIKVSIGTTSHMSNLLGHNQTIAQPTTTLGA